DLADEILLAHRHAGAAAPAAALRAVGRQRHALDVAAMAHRHDHVLALDERLDIGLELDLFDDRAARRHELLADLAQLLAEHFEETGAAAENGEIALDLADDLVELGGDLVAL